MTLYLLLLKLPLPMQASFFARLCEFIFFLCARSVVFTREHIELPRSASKALFESTGQSPCCDGARIGRLVLVRIAPGKCLLNQTGKHTQDVHPQESFCFLNFKSQMRPHLPLWPYAFRL